VALWFGDSASSIPSVQSAVVGSPHRDVEYAAAGATLTAMERARDGNIYGIDLAHNAVVTITPAGVVTSATVPTPNAGLSDLAIDPDGPVWFVEHAAGKIGQFTPPNTFVEYPIPTHDLPQSIAFDGLGRFLVTLPSPHNIAIFSAPGGGYVGSVAFAGGSPRWIVSLDSGAVVDYIDSQNRNWLEPIYVGIPGGTLGLKQGFATAVPGTHGVGRMVTGPNCSVWFPETGAAVGMYSPNPPVTLTEYATSARPGTVSPGDDGGIWFSEPSLGVVARENMLTGRIILYSLGAGSRPTTLAAGADGALWISETGTQKVARFLYH
jgi:virginiamycin B lyase